MRLTVALEALRQIGARRFILEVPPWLVRRRYLFYAAPAHRTKAAQAGRVPFHLEPLRQEDVHHLVAMRPGFYTVSQVQERLREGHLAFVGRSQDAMVHALWFFVGSVYLPYLSRRLALAPGEVYLDEIYTVPAFRRQGIVAAVSVAVNHVYRARGIRRIICAIPPWNPTLQRLAEAQGYTQVGSGGYWNIAGRKKFFWEGALRDHGDGCVSVGS